MSLIQEALKKAQRGPWVRIPRAGIWYGRGRAGRGKRLWRLLGMSLAAVAVLFFIIKLPTIFLGVEPAGRRLRSAPLIQPNPTGSPSSVSPPARVVDSAPGLASAPLKESSGSAISPPARVVDSAPGLASAPLKESSPPSPAQAPSPIPMAAPLPVVQQPQPARLEPARAETLPPAQAVEPRGDGKKTAAARQVKEDSPSTPRTKARKETVVKPTVKGQYRYYFDMGVLFQNQREYGRAFEAYRKAVELNPFHAEAYNNLGVLYKEIGELEKAIEHYRKALAVDPNYVKAYNNLGVGLIQQGSLDEAVVAFEQALLLDPKNLESYTNLGVIYKRRNLIPKAIRAFEAALSIDPDHAEAHYNIALVMEEQGRLAEAVQHYRRFVTNAQPHHRKVVTAVITRIRELSEGAAGSTLPQRSPR